MIRERALADRTDLEVAVALTRLLIEEFRAYGTSGGNKMNDEEASVAIKAHRAVLERLGLSAPRLPFRNFSAFRDYWIRAGMSDGGGWAKRRDCVDGLFGPVRDVLEELQDAEFRRRSANLPGMKNLIFAADGPKPQLVLRDVLTYDVQIVKNAEHCLVYSDPLPPHGLSWRTLVVWWNRARHPGADAEEIDEVVAGRTLYTRLRASLDSEPERTVFHAYCTRYGEPGGFDLPALIPQVYLHYDPYTRGDFRSIGTLPRQRMDFLLLGADRSRIVLEVDGVQHYSTADKPGPGQHIASPRRYSQMAAEDRRLRLAGYEVFRFGGFELSQPDAEQMLKEFFDDLLKRIRHPA